MKRASHLADLRWVRPVVRTALRYKKMGTALDLGCGFGRHSLFLAKKGFRVTAVDNKTEVLAALKELARLQKLPVTVRREDATTYVPSKRFDLVLSTMLLHFVPNLAQKRTVRTMQEHTKEGGLNVVSSYTDRNRKGTRPHLLKAGLLKQLYGVAGWKILYHKEGAGEAVPDFSRKGKLVRIWKEEIVAQKPTTRAGR